MGVVYGEVSEKVGRFSKYIRFEVGVGDRVKFWTDQWCGDSPFHLSFPVVYGIATNREAYVASSLERLGT